ncbi:MAG: PQQ-dependent sugar dehydrogenase [Alphaproteobacteria bacterium]
MARWAWDWAQSGALAMVGALIALAAQAGPMEPPGTRIEVKSTGLPPVLQSQSAFNGPMRIERGPKDLPIVPQGFRVNLFASGLDYPRWLAIAPNGDVFLAEPNAGEVRVLRDLDGDGKADLNRKFAEGFDRPHGLAFFGNYLYVGDTKAVWKVSYEPGDTQGGARVPVTRPGMIGTAGAHWTRNVAFAPDGKSFFVAIGSAGNVDEEALPLASVQQFATADGAPMGTWASGLRNPVGIAFNPGTNDLYVAVNERDTYGNNLVPDYLTKLEKGDFYGWPYAYIGPHPDPQFGDKSPGLVQRTKVPDLLFQAHSAPLGLVFYNKPAFPLEYRGGAFVALHGSWNRQEPTGYKVVYVPFKDGKLEGDYITFASGFWKGGDKQAQVWGRPAGLAVAADGSLLIADDTANVIWSVSYSGQ